MVAKIGKITGNKIIITHFFEFMRHSSQKPFMGNSWEFMLKKTFGGSFRWRDGKNPVSTTLHQNLRRRYFASIYKYNTEAQRHREKNSVSLCLCVDIDIRGFILSVAQFITRERKQRKQKLRFLFCFPPTYSYLCTR